MVFLILMAVFGFFAFHATQAGQPMLSFVLQAVGLMVGFMVVYFGIGFMFFWLWHKHDSDDCADFLSEFHPEMPTLSPLWKAILSIGLLVAAAEFWAAGNISWSAGAVLSLFVVWGLLDDL